MKNIDFSKGVRGKYAETGLRVVGDKLENSPISWAICVTSKEINLIPLKTYEVMNCGDGYKVADETSETKIYPHEYFLPINLLENEVEILNEFSLSI